MNGMPPPLSGANAGAAASRGRNGQGNGGDDIDDTSPTEEGADAATWESSRGIVEACGGDGAAEVTIMPSFWEARHALMEPSLKLK